MADLRLVPATATPRLLRSPPAELPARVELTCLVLVFDGELTALHVVQLRTLLSTAIAEEGDMDVLLDMSRVSAFDVVAARTLLTAQETHLRRQHSFRIDSVSPAVEALFDEHPDLREALMPVDLPPSTGRRRTRGPSGAVLHSVPLEQD